MRGSNGVSLPRQASTVSAPATKAAAIARSAANRPTKASAVDTWVPFRSASPSFGPSTTGARPAAFNASRPGIVRPSKRASPSPISTAERCASGARSPDAPTEPCAGIEGTTPAFVSATSASITLQRTPECPRASDAALSAMIETNDGIVEQRSRPRRVGQHERALQLGEPRRVDARPREQPEAGVDAVDRASGGNDARDRVRGGIDARPGRRLDSQARRRGPQAAKVG